MRMLSEVGNGKIISPLPSRGPIRRASGLDECPEYRTPPCRPARGVEGREEQDPTLTLGHALPFPPVILAGLTDEEAGEQGWGSGCMATSSSQRPRAGTPDHLLLTLRAWAVTRGGGQPEKIPAPGPSGNFLMIPLLLPRVPRTAHSAHHGPQGNPRSASLGARSTSSRPTAHPLG